MAKAKKLNPKLPATHPANRGAKTEQKKRNKLPPYKMVTLEGTIGVAIGDAFSEFQSLRDEMQEIVDNMSGSNMEHLPKYETADSAQSELEEHADAEPSDVPEELASIAITYTEMVNRKKGRGPSRDTRCSNAQSLLQATIDALEVYASERDGEIGSIDEVKSLSEAAELPAPDLSKLEEAIEARKSAAEELAQELQEHVDFTVDFPGFYG